MPDFGVRHTGGSDRHHDLLRPTFSGSSAHAWAERGAGGVCADRDDDTRLLAQRLEVELRGHAIANGFFVAGVNRVGTEFDSTYYGASVFIDPIGEVIAQAANGEEVLIADLDLDRLEEVRKVWPFYRDRRPDAYPNIVDP